MSSGNFQKAFLNNFTIFITLKGNKIIHGLDGSRYHYDGAWWRHEALSAAEMMEEAWKSGRQVCRLLLAMDR